MFCQFYVADILMALQSKVMQVATSKSSVADNNINQVGKK